MEPSEAFHVHCICSQGGAKCGQVILLSPFATRPRPLATQLFLSFIFLLLLLRRRLLPVLARLAAVARPPVRQGGAALGHHAPPGPAAHKRGILGRTRRAVRQPVAARAHRTMRRICATAVCALVPIAAHRVLTTLGDFRPPASHVLHAAIHLSTCSFAWRSRF